MTSYHKHVWKKFAYQVRTDNREIKNFFECIKCHKRKLEVR